MDKLRPGKRIRNWHRRFLDDGEPKSQSLKEFARALVERGTFQLHGEPSGDAKTARLWLAGKRA